MMLHLDLGANPQQRSLGLLLVPLLDTPGCNTFEQVRAHTYYFWISQ